MMNYIFIGMIDSQEQTDFELGTSYCTYLPILRSLPTYVPRKGSPLVDPPSPSLEAGWYNVLASLWLTRTPWIVQRKHED